MNLVKGDDPLIPEQLQEYFKFSFVGNPWSRLYSWCKNVIWDDDHQKSPGIVGECSLKRSMNECGEQWLLRSQLDRLTDQQGGS